MVHIYNGILLDQEKEHIWVSSSEVAEPRAYHTEWSKSEREKQALYINAYIWNIEKWYWWIYLQGSNRDANIENRLVDTVAEGEGWMNWEHSIETYTLPYVKQIASGNLLYATGSSNPLFCDNLEEWGWEGGSGGKGHMYTCDWLMLMYGGNHHSIVKQLSFH